MTLQGRARRIADKKRMKAKRVRPNDINGVNADHLAECSCFMCGNPRKWWNEKTLQERRFEASFA